VSSIRLFILDAFERRGAMHGHQLRLYAEQERVSLWTDISVGALYGALKRLSADGLLAVVRTEREGHFPERSVYALTDAGRHALVALREEGLRQVGMKPDPFDLAMTRLDPARLGEFGQAIEARLAELRALLAERVDLNTKARPYLTLAEVHALSHREHQLRAEIAWHESLLAEAPAIVADETSRISKEGKA
jgi:DNA-binding PadR family transcriptional regulator